ncbi:MAG TPA: YicC family protein [Prolixibacteraceae bacterium]|nr:YicC family protein [Bacteroidales bacterium]HPJ78120.1 YicC family protein [Prolixibacteraceae bacterium]HRV88392.1 YicC family protein [Prolixibacteraceae bacterium]
MIKSMTGFGKSAFEINNKKVTVEIKSLNSKQSDISTRIPPLYREKELEIRRELSDRLVRGKIDFTVYVENLGESGSAVINSGVVKGYFADLSKISHELQLPVNERLLQIIMRLPDTVKVNYETLEEEEWQLLHTHISTAIDAVEQFRLQEGKAMAADLLSNLKAVEQLLKEIEPFEQQRIETIKNRLNENLESLRINGNTDPNRFEQELIFYLERLDFNEEKVRLANHCRYFTETMNETESNGRKLSFIAQEIGREINTIGSKANESNIQRIVVQMKDALERIKEQVLNVL